MISNFSTALTIEQLEYNLRRQTSDTLHTYLVSIMNPEVKKVPFCYPLSECVCENCGVEVSGYDKYCSNCGLRFK